MISTLQHRLDLLRLLPETLLYHHQERLHRSWKDKRHRLRLERVAILEAVVRVRLADAHRWMCAVVMEEGLWI